MPSLFYISKALTQLKYAQQAGGHKSSHLLGVFFLHLIKTIRNRVRVANIIKNENIHQKKGICSTICDCQNCQRN